MKKKLCVKVWKKRKNVNEEKKIVKGEMRNGLWVSVAVVGSGALVVPNVKGWAFLFGSSPLQRPWA